MASDESPGKSGSRVTETAKLGAATVEKGPPGRAGAIQHKQRPDICATGSTGTPGADRPRHPSISSDLADQIGARLRSVYDDVLVQPVPERFMDLLRQLEGGPAASFARAKKDGQ